MPKVYSRRKGAEKPPSGAVYIGRPSYWGNPFPVEENGREYAIKRYREWLLDDPVGVQVAQSARTHLRGKDLVCWCAPRACHGDVLLEIANA